MEGKKFLFMSIFVLLLGFGIINAQISDKITLHGFGAWGYHVPGRGGIGCPKKGGAAKLCPAGPSPWQ